MTVLLTRASLQVFCLNSSVGLASVSACLPAQIARSTG